MTTDPDTLLTFDGVSKTFPGEVGLVDRVRALLGRGPDTFGVRALTDVSFSLRAGDVVGIVGESGCGKSTLARIAAGLDGASGGRVLYRGTDLATLSGPRRQRALLDVQMVFQDPFSSLNPRHRIVDAIGRAPVHHGFVSRRGVNRYVDAMLDRVGLPASCKERYPHEFSGGQRQRIAIARALAMKPRVLICDEIVSALDVSIQAQILNLLSDLQAELGLTCLFISHDLGVISHVCQTVLVMYLGRIVERGRRDDIFNDAQHPYTQALLKDAPRIHSRKRVYDGIKGEMPSPLRPPPGCTFHPRCPKAEPCCRTVVPPEVVIRPGHVSACHLSRPATTQPPADGNTAETARVDMTT